MSKETLTYTDFVATEPSLVALYSPDEPDDVQYEASFNRSRWTVLEMLMDDYGVNYEVAIRADAICASGLHGNKKMKVLYGNKEAGVLHGL